MSTAKLVRDDFAWDEEDEISFEGWHDPKARWNGWATPAFEKHEADRLAAYQNDYAREQPDVVGTLTFDANNDAYVLDETEMSGDADARTVFRGFDREGKHLYGIGAFHWTWMEIGR